MLGLYDLERAPPAEDVYDMAGAIRFLAMSTTIAARRSAGIGASTRETASMPPAEATRAMTGIVRIGAGGSA